MNRRMMVRLDRALVAESLAKAPREITLHARDPEHDMPMQGRHVVFAPTSGPPNIMDTARGRRAGTFEDFTNIMKLCQSYEVIHVLGGGVEPQDVPVHVRHLETTRAMMMLTDKVPKVFARGPGQNADNFELLRIGYGLTREEFESRPYVLHGHQHELAAAARHSDGERHHGLRGRRAAADHHSVHARGRDGARDDRRRAHPGAYGVPRRPDARAAHAPGRARDVRKLHVQRRHEVRLARIRNTRVREGRLRRRPARPATSACPGAHRARPPRTRRMRSPLTNRR